MSKCVKMVPQLIRRYLARTFGVMVIAIILFIAGVESGQISLLLSSLNGLSLGGKMALLYGVCFALMVVYFVCEVMTTLIFGRTVGKIIYGISVKDHDGDNASPALSLKRSALAWSVGLGLMLPYLYTICLIISLVHVCRRGASWWDQKLSTYEQFSPYRWWQWVLGIMAYIAPCVVLVIYVVRRFV
ncbi:MULTISPECIES: RDD family protein [unclassified Saccharibacter]|nr:MULTISPECIES: RDD family protein [unclassified Saccharibacter]MXV58640.1 hypothetical protein [Saccharibacter sp. EH70]MXV66146.1 hypothetical protein [Saccharibacter sp. EH60]